MEVHIGEDRNEVEQHAKADGISRDELRIAQMPEHLPDRGAEPFGAHEGAFARQQGCDHDGADKR